MSDLAQLATQSVAGPLLSLLLGGALGFAIFCVLGLVKRLRPK